MRAVSEAWGALNASKSRERRFYFKVETIPGNTAGDVYILSHADIVIGAGTSGMVEAGFWGFSATGDGWTAANATLTTNPATITVDAAAADPQFISPAISVDGSVHTLVRARIRRLGGSAWDGSVLYTTSGHGFSTSFRKTLPDPTVDDDYVIVEWDMADLTAGGDDWATSTITQIRLDLGEGAADDFEVDWVAIGNTTPQMLARPKSHPRIRTQTLNPDEGRATIGTMNFDAIDVASSLTARLRLDLNVSDIGWRNKRVEFYSGFRQIPAADYELEDTQLIDRVTYSRGVYQFRCRDVQREVRKRIFEPVVMRLAQPVGLTDTTIEVTSTAGLQAVEHGTSYSDAPSLTVAYVKIDDEIIRVPAAGIGATQLTGVTRGVLRTRAAEHTTDETASSARGKEVTEVIYLELPVPKLVYALLTGVLIQQTGTLPDHWHLGIAAAQFVRLSEFQNIGADFYVETDDTLGMIEQYILTDSEDGKQFIEKQILRKYGLFMPVHVTGELGLRRGQPVLSGSAVVGEINDSHLVSEITMAYAMDKVINEIRIGWNEIDGEPSRNLIILDEDSVNRWESAPRLEIVARGLVGSRQTDSRVRDIFEGLRDRYSGPPLICEAEVHSSQSLYEVGDVIRLRTSTVRDFTSAAATTLDRAFEVQGVSKDLAAGTVTYSLFGSSQKAGNLPPLESTTALPDSFYAAVGTDIATLPGVTDSGFELVLPDGLSLTGHADIGNSTAIYYATKDVRIPNGNTVNYTQNVQLRIRGVFQNDGELNGVGAGLAGIADTVSTSSIPEFGAPVGPVPFATQAGTPGYFGVTQAGGGLIERVRLRSGSSSRYRVQIQSLPATITQGAVEAIPSLNLEWDGSAINGIPSDLRGSSGGPGGLRYWHESRNNNEDINRGGAGGAGGAGLLIIARGMVFGASGRINSSGADGAAGVRNALDERPAWSGGGAGGAPGATLILLDGSSSPSPVLTDGTIIADYGATPDPGDPSNVMPDSWFHHQDTRFNEPTVDKAFVQADRASFFTSGTSGRQAGIAAARYFFLLPPVDPEEDTEDVVLANEQDISLGITEGFEAVDDTKVTTLLAAITENATTAAYSHANIYVRGNSAGAQYRGAWTFMGPAEPSLRFELPADGETYDVRAVPVLINGTEASVGVEQQQVVSEPGLGYTRNVWRGAWANGIAYAVGDMVSYNNRTYICILAHTSATSTNEPSGTAAGNTWWEQFVEPGSGSTIYYQSSAPTGETGAYWIDSDTDYLYRWNGSAWVLVQDDDIAQAISDAADAQSTADGKIVTFAQASAPTADGVGDVWLDTDDDNHLYRWNGSAWVDYEQDVADWAKVFGAAKPEDNATAGADVGTNLRDAAGNVISDQVITNFDDASALNANAVFADWSGSWPDNWLNWNGSAPVKETSIKLVGPHAARYNAAGTALGMYRLLTSLEFSSDSVVIGSFDMHVVDAGTQGQPGGMIDLQTSSGNYYRKEVPADTTKVGVWQRQYFKISENDYTTISGTPSGDFTTLRLWTMAAWNGMGDSGLYFDGEVIFGGLRFAILSPDIENEAQLWNDINGIPDQLRSIFYQSTAPTANQTGDYWIDSDTNLQYRWNGSSWVEIQDDDISAALSDAATAQATADGKIVAFAQASAPTAEGVGDIWLDTDDNNRLYRWSGAAWVEYAQEEADWALVFGTGKPEDNATNNTGALADQDTVGQFDIDTFAAHRTSFAQVSSVSVAGAGGSYVTVETVNITLPATITDSAVLVEVSFVFLAQEASPTGTSQAVQTLFCRILDDDNAVIQEQGVRYPVIMDNVNEASVFSRYAMQAQAITIRVPVADLNANQANTFTFQVLQVSGFDSANVYDVKMRATLLNQAE